MRDDKLSHYATGYDEEGEKPIDFKYYLFLVKKNFYVILTFFIIAVTLAVIYTSKIPDKYQASVQLMIERPRQNSMQNQMNSDESTEGFAKDYYDTQVEIMQAPAVLRQVDEELKLADYFGVSNEELSIVKIRDMVRVQRIGDSRLFNILVTATEPQLASRIANAIARSYIRKNFENMLYYSKEILGWLPQQGGLDEKVSIEDPFGNVKQVSREELIETLPSIQTDPTIRTLREKKAIQEAELETLLKQFREKHPTVIKARANIRFLEESISQEKKRLIESLKSQAEGTHRVGNARIIEEAKVPKDPLPVKRGRLILIVALGELFLSILILVLLDYFDDTLRSVEDFERKGISLPFLGHVPLVKRKSPDMDSRALMGFYEKNSDIAESFRYLRVAINFSASPESLRNLVFASCVPHEGKSFVSHNIAISLAMDGNKTLLVDCDLRRPVVHKTFKVDNTTGLSNYLTSNLEFDAVVKESFVENLSLVLSGPVSPNPGEILGSERMQSFLEEARKRYDRIILDCPPFTGLGDTFVLGSKIGQVVLIVAAGKTPVDLIKHTHKQLDKASVKVIGVVLNMVDIEKERYGGYSKHYYHTYTRYYHGGQSSA
jgi:capsular exopolysaccharide synthesis family protein